MESKYDYTIKALERRRNEAVETYGHVVGKMHGDANSEKEDTLSVIVGRITELNNAIKILQRF